MIATDLDTLFGCLTIAGEVEFTAYCSAFMVIQFAYRVMYLNIYNLIKDISPRPSHRQFWEGVFLAKPGKRASPVKGPGGIEDTVEAEVSVGTARKRPKRTTTGANAADDQAQAGPKYY
jgi:hypothetical protein